MQHYIFTFLFFFASISTHFSQNEPCNTGTEQSCTCSSAPVLCSINDLNGYVYSMSTNEPPTNQSPPTGSGNLCGVNSTVINNPTWFSFIAWCSNLTLRANVSNCIDNPNNPGISLGIQAAVYSSCSNPNSCIGSSAAGCGSPVNRTINLTGLTIGGRYYFLVDGCAGSACNVTIEVIGNCTLTVGNIQQTQGPSTVCGSTTGTYSIPPVQGASTYHWYLDGINISNGSSPSVSVPFTTPGIYQLCVDISNFPCLLESDNPVQSCFQIEVLADQAEAGALNINTSPTCPGQTISFDVAGYNTNTALFTEKLFITNAAGTIIEMINGTSGTFTRPTCGTYRLYSYNYATTSIQPVLGLNANTLICNDCFCDVTFQTLIFEDNQPPAFSNLPSSMAVSCVDDIPPPVNLDWTDNCAPSGTSVPVINQQYTACAGGTITRTWTATDVCNNTTTHSQIITISPIPVAVFTPYPDVNIQCSEINTFDFDKVLSYDNGASGTCVIMGTIPPVRNNANFINCQGNITLTWNRLDICNRPINDVQVITVTPPPVADFINPPDFQPIACQDASSFTALPLDYSNNSIDCPVMGTIAPTKTNNFNICGGNISVQWSANDICQRPLSLIRNIAVLPASAPVITSPLPQDVTIPCGPAQGYNIPLSYSNGGTGACVIAGTITPTVTQNYNVCGGSAQISWSIADICGNNPNHFQQITILPAPPATFTNLPPETVFKSCSDLLLPPQALNYSNGISGNCGNNGSVLPSISGFYDICGGTLVYVWSFSDQCGGSVDFIQNVIIAPAPMPVFINPPPSTLYLPCNTGYPTSLPLEYSNGFTGGCSIYGTVEPTFTDEGTHRKYTWVYKNVCTNEEISATQDIYLSPVPNIQVNPKEAEICAGDSFNLSSISVVTNGGNSLILSYYKGTVVNPANKLLSPVVMPSQTETYTIRVTNEFGCVKDDSFVLKVIYNTDSGNGGMTKLCNNGDIFVNLFQYLTNVNSFSGVWSDINNSGVTLSNPTNVHFLNVPNGIYLFEYNVPPANQCPTVPALLSLELLDPPSYEIISIVCSDDLLFYDVILSAKNFSISSNEGSIVIGIMDTVFIRNIDVGNSVSILFNSLVGGCDNKSVTISAPNCNCPNVLPPISGGDKKNCFGQPNPTIDVSLLPNYTANWYNSDTSTQPIAIGTNYIIPPVSNSGRYFYFVESIDTISGCPGLIKTKIIFDIISPPVLTDIQISLCDDDNDSKLSFGIEDIRKTYLEINGLPDFYQSSFYFSNVDALTSQNVISSVMVDVDVTDSIFIKVVNNDNCFSTAAIELNVNPKPKININLLTDESCLGANDGYLLLSADPNEQFSFNGSAWRNETEFDSLQPGSYPIKVINNFNCADSQSLVINEGVTSTFNIVNILCSNNSTLLDKMDDFYTVEFGLLQQNANLDSFRLFYNNNLKGIFTYNTNHLITLPADNALVQLIAVDQTTSCEFSKTIGPLNSCSSPCNINVNNLTIQSCNNNNTNNTETDDFFNISFTSSISGIAGNKFQVNIDGNTIGQFDYLTLINLSIKADNTDHLVEIIDLDYPECQTSFEVSAAPCSVCTQMVDAGPNQNINCVQNVVPLIGTSLSVGEYTWKGPDNFEYIGISTTTSIPGKYYFYVLFPDQCVGIDSVIVFKDADVPFGDAGENKILNCINQEVTLTGISTPSTNVTLIWTDIAGNQVGIGNTLVVDKAGNYYFEVINNINNCSSGKDEVTVAENNSIPEALIIAEPGNLLDCVVGTIILSGKEVPNVIFNWQKGESFINNQRSIVVNSEGWVTMTAIDTINGCENFSTLEIIDLQDYPILVTTPALPITCINNSVYLIASDSPQGPNLVFSWYDIDNNIIQGETNDSLLVEVPSTYYVVLTDTLNKCSNRDTFVVERKGEFPIVTLPSDISLYCGADQTTISASVQSQSDPVSYEWKTTGGEIISDPNQNSISARGDGNYTLVVTNLESGCKTTESVKLIVNKDFPSSMELQIKNESCKDEGDGSISIVTIIGGINPYNFSINGQPSGNSTIFTPLLPNNYRIEIIDANGCKYDTLIFVEKGFDISISADSPFEIAYDQLSKIEVNTNLASEEIVSVKWNPSDNLTCDTCLITFLKAKLDNTYEVSITDIHGCIKSINISVRVKENIIITTPNIINSGSTSNNYFTIYGNESVINIEKLRIFDRWGNLVFLKNDFKPNMPQEGWDGKIGGSDVVPGVYVFVVEYLAPSGIKTLAGDVTLIK